MENNEQQQADKKLVIDSLRKVITDKKSSTLDRTRAADTMGRLSEYNWFSKPQDAAQQDLGIDANTLKTIAELAERVLGTCKHCGGKL